jgi:serine protease Do
VRAGSLFFQRTHQALRLTRRVWLPTVWVLAMGAAMFMAVAAQAAPDLDLVVESDSVRAVLVALSGSVLRVEAPRAQGGFSLGSAVVIDHETVVTNCHVTRDARQVFVVRGGARWPAATQRSDVDHDLCVLHVPELRGNPVPIGRSGSLLMGQTVLALGYTGGAGLQNSRGDVVGLHRHDGGRVVQSNNGFNSGASGGGLFNTEGQLVGILTFRLRGAEQAYFSAPTEWLQSLLQDFAAHAAAVAPLAAGALPYWQQDTAAQPRFLRAASMLQARRFMELETLASSWLKADDGDAEPWHLLGAAWAGQQRNADARWALDCSLALEPAHGSARRLRALLGPGPAAQNTQPSKGGVSKPCHIL